MSSMIYVMRHAKDDAIQDWNNKNKDKLLSAIKQQDRGVLECVNEYDNAITLNPINRVITTLKETAQEMWKHTDTNQFLSVLKKHYVDLNGLNKYNVAIVSGGLERTVITAKALEEILKEDKKKTKLITDGRANCDTYRLHEIVAEYKSNNLANNVIIISHEPDIKRLCGFSKFGNLDYVGL